MKKLIILLTCIASIGSMTVKAQEMKLEDVLTKYFQAVGMEKIREWKTVTVTGKSMAQGMEYPITIIMKRPGKIRVEVEIQGNKMLQGFDGEHGWSVIPWSGSTDPQDMTVDEVKVLKDQADFEGALYNWKEKGHKAELVDKEDMDGTSVYKIKVVKANGNSETNFIDAENFVLLKTTELTKINGNETESDSYASNYKEVNGAQLPFSVENKIKGQTVSSVVIDKYEVNKEIDDHIFDKPAKK
jgi:hypothetical protein